MARIGFISLYAPGHLNPSITLARALQETGHEPIFFNLLDTAHAISSAGIRFIRFGEAEYPRGALKTIFQKTGELSGTAAFGYYLERMALLFTTSFRYLPELIRRERIDVLVIDQAHCGGATIAEHLNIPFVSLANALLLNREDVIPPPTMLWPFDLSPEAIERNRKGWAATDQACTTLLGIVNGQRRTWNLPEYTNLVEDSVSRLAQICQQPAIFEFPRLKAPPTLHFVGHLRDEHKPQEISFPWEWLDGRPLIYASCGTIQNRLEHIFRAIVAACAPLDAQTVIALGSNALSPELFAPTPENIKVVTYAPQSELLRHASVCITHAGLNTTLDCLEHGVPMVAIPIASEQPGIAMRIVNMGAGVVIPLPHAMADRIQSEVNRLLSEPGFREHAGIAAQEIAKLRPTTEAVRIIEQVLMSVPAALDYATQESPR